jgi:Coenzyme PQQ synthesis protein D (PqqD)
MAIRIPQHVRSVIDPDGAVLLDLRQGKYFSLNRLGIAIWQQLEAGISRDTIAATLAKTYNRPLPAVEADVDEFLAGLTEARLINVHE